MLSFSHARFKGHFEAQGFECLGSGICAGIAQMAIQAFLVGAKEFSQFNNRLEFIAQHNPTQLSKDINRIKSTLAERSLKSRTEKKREPVIFVTDEEQNLLDVAAFFEGVELYLHSMKHKDVFGKLVPQPRVQDVLPFAESHALSTLGGARVVDAFPGIYTRLELQNYLIMLDKIVHSYTPTCDLALGLDGVNHRISLLFDSVKGEWILVDANNLPPNIIPAAMLEKSIVQSLAEKIGEGPNPSTVAFNTTIYSTDQNRLRVKGLVNILRRSVAFKNAHAITLSKIDARTSILNVSLLNIVAKFEYPAILHEIISAKSPATINACGFEGQTAIHTAADLNNPEMVMTLLDAKASMDVKDNKSNTPFHIAICVNAIEAVKVFISRKPDVLNCAINTNGWLPIHLAAQCGHVELIELFYSIDPKLLETPTKEGSTALFLAVENNRLQALKTFLRFLPTKAVDQANHTGNTPLLLAALKKTSELLQILVNAKANVNTQNSLKQSALHIAVDADNAEMVQILLDAGASPNLQDEKLETPLHLAAKRNNRSLMKLLFVQGADVTIKNSHDQTAYEIAGVDPTFTMVGEIFYAIKTKVLKLQSNHSTDSELNSAFVALHAATQKASCERNFAYEYKGLSARDCMVLIATESNNSAVLRFFGEDKFSMDVKNKNGKSAFLRSIELGFKEVFDVFVEQKIDFTASVNDTLETAMHLAISGRHYDMFNVLLEKAPSIINKKNAKGETPLAAAARTGQANIVKKLIDAKADVTIACYNYLPIHLAIMQNHLESFNYLAKVTDLTTKTSGSKNTLVSLIAELGRTDFLRSIIADVREILNEPNANLMTPLMLAIYNHQKEMALFLISFLTAADINMQDQYNSSPLSYALEANNLEIMQALLHKGANPNILHSSKLVSLTLTAVQQSKLAAFKLLLKYGAAVNLESKGVSALTYSQSPLGMAINFKNILSRQIAFLMKEFNLHLKPYAHACLQLNDFIQKRFTENYEAFAKKYATALTDYTQLAFIAAELDVGEVLKLILTKTGISINNGLDFSLSQVAALHNSSCILKILKDEGVDLNQKTLAGETPVFLASREGNVEALRALIELKADITLSNCDKQTPLHAAILSGQARAVSVLVSEGASLECKDIENNMPLDLASKPFKDKLLSTSISAATFFANTATRSFFVPSPDFIENYFSSLKNALTNLHAKAWVSPLQKTCCENVLKKIDELTQSITLNQETYLHALKYIVASVEENSQIALENKKLEEEYPVFTRTCDRVVRNMPLMSDRRFLADIRTQYLATKTAHKLEFKRSA